MPGVETNDFEPESAEFRHQPWGHRSRLDPYAGVIPRMIAADLRTAGRSRIPTGISMRVRHEGAKEEL